MVRSIIIIIIIIKIPELLLLLGREESKHTTGATSGAVTVYPSEAPGSLPVFSGVRVVLDL